MDIRLSGATRFHFYEGKVLLAYWGDDKGPLGQTILIARAKVHAEDYNEFASVLLAVARPQPPRLLSPVTNRFIVKQNKSDKLSAFRDER
ncbi:predicted protein [Sclerotinia sclerotiorum 1980 UF-70]|uniref:Uncharacterized protein n=1 Tax=Sclerotinia sclerotiorum (strain ATCC 18683 / 1980 / Ss-1) TaxID=665079 RepID=A7F2H0_SCLS1|nr:predicted protein [Sclerotinia sclerotiorum 1980 UF-70]EDN95912.1 predicted protein [Sclerotinia sclerotiorum 1980 UF-70]